MQIEPNSNVNRFNTVGQAKSSRTQAGSESQATSSSSFEGTSALESALAAVPNVRPEAVSRAQSLIADPNYPSATTLKTLSSFLAKHILEGEDK